MYCRQTTEVMTNDGEKEKKSLMLIAFRPCGFNWLWRQKKLKFFRVTKICDLPDFLPSNKSARWLNLVERKIGWGKLFSFDSFPIQSALSPRWNPGHHPSHERAQIALLKLLNYYLDITRCGTFFAAVRLACLSTFSARYQKVYKMSVKQN